MTTSEHSSPAGCMQHHHVGPLSIYIDRYAFRLVREGHRQSSVWRYSRLTADLSLWLGLHRIDVCDLDEKVVARYLADRANQRSRQSGDRAALKKLLEVLRDIDVIAPQAPTELSACERHFIDFGDYLARELGLVPGTIASHRSAVRLFLQEVGVLTTGDFARLNQAVVIGFVERHANDYSPGAARHMCSSLRAFLRYLRWNGWISLDLAGSVPTVRRWRQATLPTYLSAEQVQQVLDGCNRQSAVGRRDFAILMLLARLGLRANEVATLTLDDFDWRSGQVLINGKGRQRTPMPLPRDVGTAITDYLRDGRPKSGSRRLFLRDAAPHVGFATPGSIFKVANSALRRAGIKGLAHMGAHLFRHSLATELLRAGASLTEIGQLLRHRDHDTTRLYAKVDIDMLRRVSPGWPGDVR